MSRRFERFFSRERGFTLIELMIVLVIVAVLAAIAYPSYVSYVMRTHRAAAQACLSQYANWMERYYTTHLRYDQDSAGKGNPLVTPPLMQFECATAQKTGSRYRYTFSIPTPTTYTLTATPIGAQTGDTQCGALTLDQSGAQGSVASCWK